ncbi:WAP four-disulfide core domain protein 13-like [Bos taurus]|uniref:WAP four-disulfide core domain protein 13-like n=1 Tax=Bos taurus TaxID=9913 RepID=UPI000572D935|nr:WAP four-disulfide core domain protein 13-like [Bos taurus]
MPSPGVVAEDGEEAEPDGALREGHVVSQLPTLKPFLSPCRTWPKCWVFCQAHLDMSGVSVMKLLGLPLLMLSCMAILPVSGSWKEKIDSPFELPPYIEPKLKLKPCNKSPTNEQCAIKCKLHTECQLGHHCCSAFCGDVCMLLKPNVSSNTDHKISNILSTVQPTKHP